MAIEQQVKHDGNGAGKPRTRRTRLLASMAHKYVQEAERLEEMVMREEDRNLADHNRVCTLANAATGGAFTSIMKKSTSLTEDDKAFLKELGYI